MALTIFDDFEDGDVAEWTTPGTFTATTNRVFSGSYSSRAGSGNLTNQYIQAYRDFGEEIGKIELYFQEPSTDSQGGAYSLIDSAGNRVCSFGTLNPQWTYTDGGTAYELYAGDGYDRWVRITATLDYSNGTYTVEFEDQQSGTIQSTTANLDTNNPATRIRIVNITKNTNLTNQSDSDSRIYQWTDKISTESSSTGSVYRTSSGVVQTTDTNSRRTQ